MTALSREDLHAQYTMVMDTSGASTTYYPDISANQGQSTTAGNSDALPSLKRQVRIHWVSLASGSAVTPGVLEVLIEEHAGSGREFWRGAIAPGSNGTIAPSHFDIGIKVPTAQGFRVVITDASATPAPVVCLGWSFVENQPHTVDSFPAYA